MVTQNKSVAFLFLSLNGTNSRKITLKDFLQCVVCSIVPIERISRKDLVLEINLRRVDRKLH